MSLKPEPCILNSRMTDPQLRLAGALLIEKKTHSAGVGGALVGALGFLSESPLDGLLGVITDVVDPEKNHRIYIGTVSVGDVTFHCHSSVHEKQVRLGSSG